MYKNVVVAIDLNDEVSCRKPLVPAVELARTFDARLYVLIVHGLGRLGHFANHINGNHVIVEAFADAVLIELYGQMVMNGSTPYVFVAQHQRLQRVGRGSTPTTLRFRCLLLEG